MKYFIFILVLAITACSAKRIQNTNKMTLIEQLQSGEDIYLRDQDINESIDLTSIINQIPLNSATSVGVVHGNLLFDNCTFKKPFTAYGKSKDFQEVMTQFKGNVSFINCKFEAEVDLKYATFYAMVDFGNSTFVQKANFQDITAMHRCNFRGAFWQDEALFQNARFYHKANFMDSKANGHMMFQSANFRDEINFSNSNYAKYVDFSLAKFDGDASFNYIKWTDRTTFSNAIFMQGATFVQPTLGSINVKNIDKRGKFLLSDEYAQEQKDK